MAYSILLTSLYPVSKDEPLRYYYAEEEGRRVYTDAMLTVEATTKYILSRHHIDEIIVLGRQLNSDAGDDERVLGVDDGKSFYASDISELSTYSLYRYRLAQFIDDLKIEQQEITELLSDEEQKEMELFLKDFYNREDSGKAHRKFSRFFDRLIQDGELYDRLKSELMERIPGVAGRPGVYLQWIRNYLYMNLSDACKMEILDDNYDTKVRFVTADVDDTGKLPIDSLLRLSGEIVPDDHDSVNIYFAPNNDDMTENFVMLGILDIVDTMYGSQVDVLKVCTSTNAHYRLAGTIRNDTEGYGMAALVTAVRTFLRYGKVDMIVDYWEHSRSKNAQIEKMIYAMRRIDTGLSLCSIGDIEKGISELRKLFINGFDLSESDYYSKLFILLSEGIKDDYGRLVTADDAGFIDLVKWAYRKGFYQQCLTLIEAKAASDFVHRGIYSYCGDESEKDAVIEKFAAARNQMKVFDYWKMDDLDHYYLKYYIFFKQPSNTIPHQRENAKVLCESLDNTDPERITAYSVCDDRQALEDLLFAYLHIGRVRNETNHANDGHDSDGTLFPSDKEVSSKLIEIQESIRYFIQSYDIVNELIEGKETNVVLITSNEVKTVAKRLEKAERSASEKKS